MKKILLFITLCLPLLFGSCAKRVVDMTVTIYGTVLDKETQEPIRGVLVTLSPGSTPSVTTGIDGKFEFTNLNPQNYDIQAQKEGYRADYRKVNNPTPGEMVPIQFLLEKL